MSSFRGGSTNIPIPKNDDRNHNVLRSCASDSALGENRRIEWLQVSEVDFYFSGGYEKPSNVYRGIYEFSWRGDEIIVSFRLG